jgi:hypothetical protein
MLERKRSIFRNEALQRYLVRQEATVIPRLLRPRGLVALWLFLAVAIAASLVILLREAPAYTHGVAVAVERSVVDAGARVESAFAILLSGADADALRPGKIVKVEVSKGEPAITASIVTVEPELIDLPIAVARFRLTAEAGSTIRFPAAVAFAHPAGEVSGPFRSGRQHIIYKAYIQQSSQRAASYLFAAGDGAKRQID